MSYLVLAEGVKANPVTAWAVALVVVKAAAKVRYVQGSLPPAGVAHVGVVSFLKN